MNEIHSIVLMMIGIWGTLAFLTFDTARTFVRATAILFAVLTILGLIPGVNTLFGLLPIHGNDIWLHAISTIVATYFGWGAPVPTITKTHM